MKSVCLQQEAAIHQTLCRQSPYRSAREDVFDTNVQSSFLITRFHFVSRLSYIITIFWPSSYNRFLPLDISITLFSSTMSRGADLPEDKSSTERTRKISFLELNHENDDESGK
jgi:hypothetical protein